MKLYIINKWPNLSATVGLAYNIYYLCLFILLVAVSSCVYRGWINLLGCGFQESPPKEQEGSTGRSGEYLCVCPCAISVSSSANNKVVEVEKGWGWGGGCDCDPTCFFWLWHYRKSQGQHQRHVQFGELLIYVSCYCGCFDEEMFILFLLLWFLNWQTFACIKTNVSEFRLCVVVVLTELYQFTPLILVTFQGHNSTNYPDITVMVDWAYKKK